MILEVELTEDMLKVLPLLNIQHNESEYTRKVYDNEGNESEETYIQHKCLIDSENLLLGTDPFEDIAFALNLALQNAPDGTGARSYDQFVYNKIESLYNYLKDNIVNIESLIHGYIGKQLTAGVYRCRDNEMIWSKVN